jgi:tetratricopeptide (TPR) repeat protein
MANLLTKFDKKVCIVDFDLEAPGIHYKCQNQITQEIEKGLVDYIYEFSANNKVMPFIADYTITLDQKKDKYNPVFIPAGNCKSESYWKKLSHINWWNLFYEENSEGISFFLDLKEKIKQELKCDYLLIDTRTGITEIAAVTMSILADAIVLFAVNNDENINGAERVIKSIIKEENNLFGVKKDIHFVLSRIPFATNSEERSRENEIKNLVKDKIKKAFKTSDQMLKSFNLIHSDREVELFGNTNSSYSLTKEYKKETQTFIITEYISLFESLAISHFSPKEKETFNSYKQANDLLQVAYSTFKNNLFDLPSKLDEIDKLVPKLPESSFLRGYYYYKINDFKNALNCFGKGEKDGDDSGKCLFFMAQTYFKQGDFENALPKLETYIKLKHREYRTNAYRNLLITKEKLKKDRDKLIDEATELIEKYPYYAHFYNIRSCLYLRNGLYEKALNDIDKAIQLDSNPLFTVTLAEINYYSGNKEGFYRFFDLALNAGYNIDDIINEDDKTKEIYINLLHDDKFEHILQRHNKLYFLDLLAKERYRS